MDECLLISGDDQDSAMPILQKMITGPAVVIYEYGNCYWLFWKIQ